MLILDLLLRLTTACQVATITLHSRRTAQTLEPKVKPLPHRNLLVEQQHRQLTVKEEPRKNLVLGAGHRR